MNSETKKETLLLAKAFYNISNAIKYIDLITDNDKISHHARYFLKGVSKTLSRVFMSVKTSIPHDSARLLEDEIQSWETLSFESVFDSMALMTSDERLQVEAVCSAILKGREIIKIKKTNEILSDAEINEAWQHANFGSQSKRDVIIETLKKFAQGWGTGHTAKCIVSELGLIWVKNGTAALSDKGLEYLLTHAVENKSSKF